MSILVVYVSNKRFSLSCSSNILIPVNGILIFTANTNILGKEARPRSSAKKLATLHLLSYILAVTRLGLVQS